MTEISQLKKRKKIFFIIGLSSIVMFLIVRFLNGYGNLNNWKRYELAIQTIFSFFNPAKYPPSISYLLMTLGPIFLILSKTENLKGKIINIISVFGKVPFFLLHTTYISNSLIGFNNCMDNWLWMEKLDN